MATSNSPNRQKHSTTSEAINGELEQSRQAVLKDANLSVPLVPVSYFKKSLLPRLRKGLDADEVVDKLRDVGHITPKGRLKVFKQSPSQTPGTEDSVFKSFGKVTGFVATQARYLLRKAKTNTKHTAEFCCNPTMTPQSTNRHSTSKPDSYGVLVARTVCNTPKNAPHWDDIVVAGEKKKKDTIADVNDNNEKILWSLHHAMRETVQRRFMFGYTIEDEMMRLWFCSRSDIIVSEQFNFITDHPTFVYFLLSIMYAEPHELGYDPTISVKRQTGDKKTNVYKISVPRQPTPDDPSTTKEYLTHEVVANISAEAMRGRATRVWRGKEVGSDGKATGPNRVIKDCWIDHNRKREGDILKEILAEAGKPDNHAHLPIIQKHLLTVIHDGDIFIEVDVDGTGERKRERDNTFDLLRRSAEFPQPRKFLRLKRVQKSQTRNVTNPPVGLITAGSEVFQWLVETLRQPEDGYDKKSHYRIVFDSEEDCVPIDTIQSAYVVWRAMYDAFNCISALHALGYVHRDISAGNMLVVRPGSLNAGVGKITDLEYCKRLGDTGPGHRGITGTRYFLPIEVENQSYHFEGSAKSKSKDSESREIASGSKNTSPANYFEAAAAKPRRTAPLPRRSARQPPLPARHADPIASRPCSTSLSKPEFVHNPLHDLEALWWLALYLTLLRPIAEEVQEAIEERQREEAESEQDARQKCDPKGKQKAGQDDGGKERSAAELGLALATTDVHRWIMRLLIDYSERIQVIKRSSRFALQTEDVHTWLQPIVKQLDTARGHLVEAYHEAEANLYTAGVDLTVVPAAREKIGNCFWQVVQDMEQNGDFDFTPMPTNFILPSVPPRHLPPACSLDSKMALLGQQKRPLEGSDGEEHISIDRITSCMAALRSPTKVHKALRRRRIGGGFE